MARRAGSPSSARGRCDARHRAPASAQALHASAAVTISSIAQPLAAASLGAGPSPANGSVCASVGKAPLAHLVGVGADGVARRRRRARRSAWRSAATAARRDRGRRGSTRTWPSQCGAGADADGRDRELLGDLGGEVERDALEHDGERARGLDRQRVLDQRARAAPAPWPWRRPCTLWPPMRCTDCGVRPMWPMTGMSTAAIARDGVGHRRRRPRASPPRRRPP